MTAIQYAFACFYVVLGWLGAMLTTVGVVRDMVSWSGKVFWAATRSFGSSAGCGCGCWG